MRRIIMMLGWWLACQIVHLVASVWMLLAILAGSRRARTLAISYDQLANAAFGGSEDETISSRAGKARREGRRWGCVLCRWLDELDAGHCERSIEDKTATK